MFQEQRSDKRLLLVSHFWSEKVLFVVTPAVELISLSPRTKLFVSLSSDPLSDKPELTEV